MKWEWKGFKCGEEGHYRKAYKRLDRLGSKEVVSWAQLTADGVYRALEAFEKEGNPDMVKEARIGILSLLAVTSILEERT